jgi:hypothetical protein
MTFCRQIGKKKLVKMGFHTLAIDLFSSLKIAAAILVWVRMNKAWITWDLWPEGYLG